MRLALAVVAALLAANEAAAVEHYLLQWKKDRRCEVVVRLPFFGSHYTQIGIYPTRWEAERALDDSRRRRECPPPAVADPPPADGDPKRMSPPRG